MVTKMKIDQRGCIEQHYWKKTMGFSCLHYRMIINSDIHIFILRYRMIINSDIHIFILLKWSIWTKSELNTWWFLSSAMPPLPGFTPGTFDVDPAGENSKSMYHTGGLYRIFLFLLFYMHAVYLFPTVKKRYWEWRHNISLIAMYRQVTPIGEIGGSVPLIMS